MILNYKITSLEKKTTSKGEMMKVSLQNYNGEVTDNVAIWGDFPDFSTLGVGSPVTGDIIEKINGKFTNRSLYPERTKGYVKTGAKPNIEKMMEKKAEYISQAQDKKNDAIGYFNSLNSAITFVSEFKGLFDASIMSNTEDAYNAVLRYRDRFLSEWQKYESDPTKGKPPFN